jgi:hypothetical protein
MRSASARSAGRRNPASVPGETYDADCANRFHRACKPTARPRLAPKRKPRRSGALAVHMHVGDTPRTLTTLNLGIGSTNWVGFLRQGMFRRRHSAGDATIRESARPVDRGWPDPQVSA